MTVMREARARFFDYWYQPRVKMAREDWIYIGVLLGVSVLSFNLGLLLGGLWILLL